MALAPTTLISVVGSQKPPLAPHPVALGALTDHKLQFGGSLLGSVQREKCCRKQPSKTYVMQRMRALEEF